MERLGQDSWQGVGVHPGDPDQGVCWLGGSVARGLRLAGALGGVESLDTSEALSLLKP